MAYVNGNKPIITNGLVYALDFGNTRSYNSGSTKPVSLAYYPTTTITASNIGFETNQIRITSSTYIENNLFFPFIDVDNSFTLNFWINPKVTGSFILNNATSSSLGGTINTNTFDLGFYVPSKNTYFTKRFTGLTTSSLQYITYRYTNGNAEAFINGILVTSSLNNFLIPAITTASFTNDVYNKYYFTPTSSFKLGQANRNFNFTRGVNSFSGSIAQFSVYNRALTVNEIYQNYTIGTVRYRLTSVTQDFTFDENTRSYIQSANITNISIIQAVDIFVKGLKLNNIWNKLIAIYPNVGNTTSSNAINLKNPNSISLEYTGPWTSSLGSQPLAATSYINIPISPSTYYPNFNSSSAHITYLSYDTSTTPSALIGTQVPFRAQGGETYYSGSKTYHVFKAAGTSSFQVLDASLTAVEVLVIAGGGSGASNDGGGGGGAGGLIYSSSYAISPGSYDVIVGKGGRAFGITRTFGGRQSGENSIFNDLIAIGGGAGGSVNGGSGGGGNPGGTSGSGVPGQGFNGGIGFSGNGLQGGGGGAGNSGSNAAGLGGNGRGGSGSYFSQYTGLGLGFPSGWFAGGGGAGNNFLSSPVGLGGIGGGGNGAVNNAITDATDGVSNTGGGGGGSSAGGFGPGVASSGGSGIVVVSYDSNSLITSSFSLYVDETSLTGSINNQPTTAITSSGPIGLVTVSRTGSNSLTLFKNTISSSFNVPASQSLSPSIYLGALNSTDTASLNSPYSINYTSIGLGLTISEVATYHTLISQLQTNLKRQNTLLDNYSGAAAAYSLRRIGPSGYFGPAIRVRRDSDNTLRDIGFTSDGQLDTVGLLDFVGVTGSGFVQTWYDQLYNNNPSEITTLKQPFVVETGSIKDDINSSALVNLDGLNKAVTVTGSFNLGSGSITMLFWIYGNFSGSYPGIHNRIQAGGHGITTAIPNNGWVQVGYQWNGSESYFIINGIKYQRNTTGRWIYDYRTQDIPIYINNYPPSPSGQNNNAFTLQAAPGGYSPNPYSWTGGTNVAFGDAFSNFGGKKFPGTMASIALYDRVLSDSEILDNYNRLLKTTDPDYQAFITATGITEPTQSAALETLVSDLKSYGLWSKMKAIYPMVTDKNNRFAQSEDFSLTWNPVSSSVTVNQITAPNGTSTADLIRETTGSNPYQTFTVVNNGASAYTIDGSDNPTLTLERGRTYVFDINASGHPFYIMTGSGAYTVDGQYNTGVTGQGTQTGTLTFAVPNNAPDTLAYVCQIHSAMGGTISVINNTDQHYVYQTVDTLVSGNEYVLSVYGRFLNRPWIALQSNDGAQAWFNLQTGVTGSFTGSRATITPVSGGWYRCALFYTASSNGAKNQHIHLADANGNYNYTGVATTGSYLWGAQFENGNVLGPYRATTTTGFTTGSMLDQMKFNLKSTSSFSGSYVGNWNPGYGGNKPDGVTGYINTNYNPSTSGLLNSAHLSHYGTTNLGIGTIFQLVGVKEGSNIQGLAPTVLGGDSYNSINSTDVPIGTIYTRVDSFILSNRNSPIEFNNWYKNNKVSTVVRNSTSIPNGNIFISGRNNNGSLLFPDLNTKAFVTIGDGLTDYEAKALYWIVQKFQTTLGRQVY
jgi:hypothetical protein